MGSEKRQGQFQPEDLRFLEEVLKDGFNFHRLNT